MTMTQRPRNQGFTLLEVLLALALGGMVMVYSVMMVVNLSLVWINRGSNDFFQQHADGVSLFLTNAFARSIGASETTGSGTDGAADEAAAPSGEDGGDELRRGGRGRAKRSDPVSWSRPPGYSEFDPPLLAVSLNEAPALLVAETGEMPAVDAYLYYERGAGLAMLWYSRLHRVDDLNDVQSTLVSSYLTNLEYAYYDREEDRWDLSEEPEEDSDGLYVLPDALKLTFTYDSETISRAVYIPKSKQNVPLF